MAAWQKSYPIQKIKVLKSYLVDVSDDQRLISDFKEEAALTSMIARATSSENLAKLLLEAYKFKVAQIRLTQIIDEALS